MEMEFKRNRERYQFLKWGQQAFKTFGLVPPGIGIVHQVNLEYLAKGVLSQTSEVGGQKSEVFYPDTLVGTDSHTTMINGLGVVGWGVGGIEAEAGMLGQPVYFLTPEVVGVHMTGSCAKASPRPISRCTSRRCCARKKSSANLWNFMARARRRFPCPIARRSATWRRNTARRWAISRSTLESVNYLRATGRTDEQCAAFENYFRAQKMFGMPRKGEIDYSVDLELDLADVQPSVAGPKRPQDRVNLPELGNVFRSSACKSR